MSLYNAIFGTNRAAPILLKILEIDQNRVDTPIWPKKEDGNDWYPYDDGITPDGEKYIQECIEKKYWTSGRFRDCYLNEDGTKIILYTRNGGGNRESYPHIFDTLRKHPNYIRDYDDDFDCTYASIEFSVPDDFKEDLKAVASTIGQKETPSDKFLAMIEGLKSGKDTPETKQAMKVGEKIFGEINEKIDKEESGIIEI